MPRLEVVQHRLRVADRGAPAVAPPRRAAVGRPAPSRAPRRSPSRCAAAASRWRREPVAVEPRAARAVAVSDGVEARVLADRGRADRLPVRHAGPRPRPRGRPRHRHGQAGRGVRRRSARRTASSATTRSSSATSRPSATSSASSVSARRRPRRRRSRPRRRRAPRRAASPRRPSRRLPATMWRRACSRSWPSRPATRRLLDLDLDLEADLGIDTVKQAEMFAADPRDLRHRARRLAQAARLPHPQPRRRLRPRPHAGGRARRAGRAAAAGGRAARPRRRAGRAAAATSVPARVLAIVAEQTGYPPELLDLDLDLEADLGIDTVKQAEVFAADPRGLRHRTRRLAQAARLPHPQPRRRASSATARPGDRAADARARPSRGRRGVPGGRGRSTLARPATRSTARVLAIVAEQTGYPPELLDLDLDLEADLGIDTVKQAEVFAADPRGLRDRARRLAQAARLPDPQPRRRLRPRPHARAPRRPARRRRRPSRRPADARRSTGRRLPAPRAGPRRCARRSSCCVADRRAARRGQPRRRHARRRRRRPTRWRRGWPSAASRCCRSTARPTPRRCERSSPTGLPPARSTGVYWLPALDDEAPARRRSTSTPGTRRCACASSCSPPPCAPAGRRRAGRSSSRPPASAAATATTPPARPSAHGRRRDRLHQGLRARARRTRWSRPSTSPPAARPATSPTLLVEETLRDPGAVEVGHADGLRWTVGLVERAAGPPTRPRSRSTPTRSSSSPARPAASSRRSPPTSPRASRRHVPPARPRPRARPGRPRPRALRRPTATGLKRELADRIARRAASGRRPSSSSASWRAIERARAALDAIDAIAARPAARPTGTRSTSPTPRPSRRGRGGARRQRPRRRAAARRRPGDQPLPARQAASASSTSSSTSRPTAGSTSSHALGDAPLGAAVVFSSIAGRFGNAGQTDYSAANDLLCKSVSHLRTRGRHARRSPSTGPPGPASAWPAAARSRR